MYKRSSKVAPASARLTPAGADSVAVAAISAAYSMIGTANLSVLQNTREEKPRQM
jgi:hypothetical protein